MINFPVLRTRRLTVQLRELSIGESITVANMPAHLNEAGCTAFLRSVVKDSGEFSDPLHWTVQERMMAVCHYLASVSDDGPDFSVGNGRFSDYLDGSDHQAPLLPETIKIGDVGGDTWHIRHLTGAMAESIERLTGEIAGITGRLHWLLGCMAAQLVRQSESALDPAEGEGAFDQYLAERMRVLSGYPESDFANLMHLYLVEREKLSHLFNIHFADDGLVALPKGGMASGLPPARFPAYSCISRFAQQLVRKSDEHGINS